MVTIPAGKHGGFTDAEYMTAYTAIRAFLAKHRLPGGPTDGARTNTTR